MSKFIFFFGFLFTQYISAQPTQDTAFFHRLIDSTVSFYTRTLEKNTLLFNGGEYTASYPGTIGHPFYASDTAQRGSIYYGGTLYQDVAMSYDLVTDEIFIQAFQNIPLKLVTEKVGYFSLLNHVFVKIAPDSTLVGGLINGYFEMLYKDSVTVLVKHKKRLKPSFKAEDPMQFAEYKRYFIQKENILYEVNNEKSLLSVFPGQRNELKKYLRTNGIQFKKDPAKALVRVAEYYAQLNK